MTKVVLVAFSGVHGTGKTTLLRTLAGLVPNAVFLESRNRKAFADLGLDPKAPISLEQRFKLQTMIYENYIEDVNQSIGQAQKRGEDDGHDVMFVITDRSLIDMQAYTLAEINQEAAASMSSELDAMYGALMSAMSESADQFVHIHVPLVPSADFFKKADEDGRAAINRGYAIHIDALLIVLGSPCVVMNPISSECLAIDDRVVAVQQTLAVLAESANPQQSEE